MEQTLTFIPNTARRVAWIDDAGVIARVVPMSRLAEHKMVASASLCSRLADLRRLARRYRDMGRLSPHSPLSASLPLAG